MLCFRHICCVLDIRIVLSTYVLCFALMGHRGTAYEEVTPVDYVYLKTCKADHR